MNDALIGLAGVLIGLGLAELTDPFFKRWGWIAAYFTIAAFDLWLVLK